MVHFKKTAREDSKYVSKDGSNIGYSNNKGSSTSAPATSRSEGEILQSGNLKNFTYNKLKNSTRNFHPDSVLGEGGFSFVFKGWVDEHSLAASRPGIGIVVAVKGLIKMGSRGTKNGWQKSTILGLRLPNLVKLIGYFL
ncbi:hypothetical protein AgCh_005036 [Apium graveolens]